MAYGGATYCAKHNLRLFTGQSITAHQQRTIDEILRTMPDAVVEYCTACELVQIVDPGKRMEPSMGRDKMVREHDGRNKSGARHAG